jgi:tRNA dimethylallyltransferase
MDFQKPLLIVIAGPTASGKTDLAIELALIFHTVIISADSRQFYKEIPIGSAAPNKNQLAKVEHYFVGNRSIHHPYNVSEYENEAISLLDNLFALHSVVIMAGGSGLYIDAVCYGLDVLPDPDPLLRHQLQALYHEQGIEALRTQLRLLDAEFYRQVDLKNPVRLMRAIEVCLLSGKSYSSLRTGQSKLRNFQTLKLALDVPKPLLIERINRRVDEMIQMGLIEEAKRLLPYKNLPPLRTVGFKEMFAYFEGQYTLEQAIEKIKINTRKFAKRQITWFKKDPLYHWVSPNDIQQINRLIRNEIQ